MKKNTFVLTLSAAVAMSVASTAFAGSNEIYLGLGSTGVGAGHAYGINKNFGVRGEFNGYSYDTDYKSSGTKYDGRLHLQSIGVYGDYFPFANAFRLSVGYVNSSNKFSGRASGHDGSVTINDVSYSLAGEAAAVTVKFPALFLIWASAGVTIRRAKASVPTAT